MREGMGTCLWLPSWFVETERDDKSKVVQAVWWCALLLVANVIVGIMVLVKLQEIAKALGA